MTIKNQELYALSILIPCHNAESNLVETFGKLESKIVSSKLKNKKIEIIFIENGSVDETLLKLNQLKIQYPDLNSKIIQSQKGLGNALRMGMSFANGSKVAFVPDDISYDLQEIDIALNFYDEDKLFILSKYIHPFIYERPLTRVIPGLVFSFLKELILKVRVWDSQSTFVGDTASLKTLLAKTHEPGFLITTEIIALARLKKIEINEIPAEKINVQLRESTLGFIDVINMVTGLIKIRFRLRTLS